MSIVLKSLWHHVFTKKAFGRPSNNDLRQKIVDNCRRRVKQEGIAVENDTTTIAQLAEKNRLTPSDVYAAIKKHFPEVEQPRQGKGPGKGQGGGKGGGIGPGRGKGRGMGREMQEQNGR